jgi:C4-type Zn-finger protein
MIDKDDRVVKSSRNERLADSQPCPKCGAEMALERLEPQAPGVELNTFLCSRCGHRETVLTKLSDSDI